MTVQSGLTDSVLELLDTLDESAALLELDGTVIMLNAAAAARLGVARHEIVGRVVHDFMPAEVSLFRRDRLDEVARTGRAAHFSDCRAERWYEVRICPIFDERRRVVRFAVRALDVTEARDTERESQARVSELQTIHAHVPVGILLLDPDRRVTKVNETAARLLGAPPAALLRQVAGAALGCLNHLDDERGCGFGPQCETCELRRAVRSSLEQGTPLDGVAVAMPINGPGGPAIRHTLVSTAPVTIGGQRQVMVSLQDVTGLRRLEAELRQSQKMEALGRLAAGVSHDFNNQLTVIVGYCDMLLADLDHASPLRQSLSQIRRATERAAATTRHLLAFSRRRDLEPRDIDLNQLVQELQHPLSRIIGDDIRIRIESSPKLRAARVDPLALQQALLNLVINSRDAMPDGGTLVLRTANRQGTLDGLAVHEVGLEVQDSGHGIAEADLERVFEPFYTTKGDSEGTGLGLSMVRGFVEQSGGRVEIRSRPGAGTTVCLVLPAVVTDAVAVDSAPTPAEPGPLAGRILVVEDSEAVRELVVDVLQRHGLTVLAAALPGDAMALAAVTAPFEVLLTDLVMPDMGGEELARLLTSRGAIRSVVYMSGYHGGRSRSVKGPLLAKPFEIEELVRTVAQALADGADATLVPEVAVRD